MNPPRDGVAIIGMSCLFPGAPNVDAYWRNILEKVDAVTDPPAEAWDVDAYYDPSFADTDKVYVKRGGYLGELAEFDPLAYGVPPVSVGGEPDQWLALQLAYDALEDAGCADLPADIRARTGIVLGKGTYLNGGNALVLQRGVVIGQMLDVVRQLHPEYTERQIEILRDELKRALPDIRPETVPGLIPNIVVGRIANKLDLMGPSYTVDAACASSLVALQLAMRDLVTGRCDLALAGGSQVWMPVPTLNIFCKLGALSRSERIRPFDKDADGTLLGEGIGMVVLKRTADALRDGDRIYAVVRGVGVASDGRGVGVMAPRVEGQELALRNAYVEAEVDPASIGLIEAHGTATALGDAVEVQSLVRVFGERQEGLPNCALGTVKSMISHTIPASGIAGVIKLALSLYHRVLPPTLNVDEPNPKLELEKTPFYINTETRPWIHSGAEPRRAGINAFGFGGINAHAVLEELPAGQPLDHLPPWESEVFILEGDSAASLVDEARRLAGRVRDGAPSYSLADLAYTLNCGARRTDDCVRLAVVATSFEDLAAKLDRAIAKLEQPDCRRIKDISGIYFEAEPLGREGKVVFVFPGEGSQYAGMLADLCLYFPEVREVFDREDRIYRDDPRGYVASDWIYPRPAFSDEERRTVEGRLMQMDIAVESVLAANEALHGVLHRLKIRPDALVGHSTGEFSAALAAGVLVIDTEERFFEFSRGMNRSYSAATSRDDLPRAVLLAIGADRERVEAVAQEAGGELFVAMDNCPHQAVLVGEPTAVERARAIVEREGLIYSELPYDRAVHTPLFAQFAEDLRDAFEHLVVAPAKTPVYSCTTGSPYPSTEHEIRELLIEHWTSAVEFRRTIEKLYDEGARVFVEAGPRGNMTGFIDDIFRGRPYCSAPADLQRRRGTTQLNHLVGMLAAHDVGADLAYLYESRKARLVELDGEPEAPRRPGTKIELATRLPMLRVPDGVAEKVRGPIVPVLALTEPHAPVGEAAASANGHAAVQASVVGTHEPVYQNLVATESDELALVMDAHSETMERFLTTHEEIMRLYFEEAELDGAPAAAAPSADTTTGFAELGPLLGTALAWSPGETLVARRTFDPAEDVYLRDHALGRDISATDPDLSALMVMPLTMSLEILAEAGSALVPSMRVVGLRDVRAFRWLAWEEEPRTLEVVARRLPREGAHERVHVTLTDVTEASSETGAPSSPAAEAIVLLAAEYPEAPAPVARLERQAPSRWAPEELYTSEMFHGPSWQGVRAIATTGPDGTTARLEVLPFGRMLRSTPSPRFVLDPVVLDAAGQVIGFWTAERLETGRVIFPFRLEALDVYGPLHPTGEPLACTAAIDLMGDQFVRSDIDVIDADGRLWMRLTSWEDKRFAVPENYRALTLVSEGSAMSSEWPEATAGLPADTVLECRRLDVDLPDKAFWTRVWAHRVLGRSERAEFRALKLPDARVLEWLGARTAAKEAVQRLVKAHLGIDLLPADVAIHKDEAGRPVVGGAWTAALDAAPVVSLAHTRGCTVALAALAGRVGIDVEYVRPREAGFADIAFSTSERELLASLPPDETEEWQLRAWCAKEAVGKAIGTGLTHGPQGLAVTALDTARGRISVELGAEMAAAHPDLAAAPIAVVTRREDDLVVASTLCEQGGPET
jgi:acyl transferase domain-containing protein/phosphopantetheinyl transferase